MLSLGLATSEDQKNRRLWEKEVVKEEAHPLVLNVLPASSADLIWKFTPNSGTYVRGPCRRLETMLVHLEGNRESRVQGSCRTIPLGCWVRYVFICLPRLACTVVLVR